MHLQMFKGVAKNFCVLYNEVEHNYISSSITLGLQLHVSALYVGHLHVVTWLSEQLYKMYGVFF
jgi:hypothetical protein